MRIDKIEARLRSEGIKKTLNSINKTRLQIAIEILVIALVYLVCVISFSPKEILPRIVFNFTSLFVFSLFVYEYFKAKEERKQMKREIIYILYILSNLLKERKVFVDIIKGSRPETTDVSILHLYYKGAFAYLYHYLVLDNDEPIAIDNQIYDLFSDCGTDTLAEVLNLLQKAIESEDFV